MCRQDCAGCPLFIDSTDGMIAADPERVIEISVAGRLGDVLGIARGAEVRIYSSSTDCVRETAPTAREALRLARERVQGTA